MKKFFYLSLLVFSYTFCSAQTDPDFDPNAPLETQFVMGFSSDTGIKIADGSDISQPYLINIELFGWTLNDVPTVINHVVSRSNYLDLELHPSGEDIQMILLRDNQITQNWTISQWNNHLATIK